MLASPLAWMVQPAGQCSLTAGQAQVMPQGLTLSCCPSPAKAHLYPDPGRRKPLSFLCQLSCWVGKVVPVSKWLVNDWPLFGDSMAAINNPNTVCDDSPREKENNSLPKRPSLAGLMSAQPHSSKALTSSHKLGRFSGQTTLQWLMWALKGCCNEPLK